MMFVTAATKINSAVTFSVMMSHHLLFIFNMVNHILFSLLGLCHRCCCTVCLRGGGSITVRVENNIIPVSVRALALVVGLSLLGLQLSISPFWGPAHFALGGGYLSFGSTRYIFNAGLKPAADTHVSAVHQLVNLKRQETEITPAL